MTVARGRTAILRLIFGELLGGFLQAHQLLAIRAVARAGDPWVGRRNRGERCKDYGELM